MGRETLCRYLRNLTISGIGMVASLASAQELEPRAYSPSPVGTNFLATTYAYSSGDVLLDPSLPLTDVEAKLHSVISGYSRTFALFGQSANIAALLPFVNGKVEGLLEDERRQVRRSAVGDLRLRLGTNFIGGEALSREEFRKRRQDTVLGSSLVIVWPTGEYNSKRLVNVGSNRWAFKPEIGGSHIFGDWFVDASSGVWFFTDNSDFYGDVVRQQDPIATIQAHGGYTFRPGLWLAGDATYYTGGKTRVGGVEKDDLLENSRYGLTFAVPLSENLTLKFACSQGFTTRIGGDFSTVAATLQYRWFDQ